MIERIDHVNLVVADLPTMTAFYRDVLGLRLTRQVTISGPWIDAVTGLAQAAADVAFVEMPAGPSIELLCYRAPAGVRPPQQSAPNAQGIRHFAFRVSDIDGLVARLKAAGVKLLSDVQQVPSAQVDFAGNQRKRLVYFLDPEGNLLELCAFE